MYCTITSKHYNQIMIIFSRENGVVRKAAFEQSHNVLSVPVGKLSQYARRYLAAT